MTRLIVVTTPELAPGYRLAGAAALEASSALEANAVLRKLLGEERGVVAVHQPFLDAAEPDVLRDIERRILPVVVGLPVGAAGDTEELRRARLARVLARAIGFRFTFRPEAP